MLDWTLFPALIRGIEPMQVLVSGLSSPAAVQPLQDTQSAQGTESSGTRLPKEHDKRWLEILHSY